VIVQHLRRSGKNCVVTIPEEEVERHGWQEGQLLGVELTEMTVRPGLRPELREALNANWERNEEALRYLADR